MTTIENLLTEEKKKRVFIKQIGIIIICFIISMLPIMILVDLNTPPAMCEAGEISYPIFPPPTWHVWTIPIGMLVILTSIVGLKLKKMWMLYKKESACKNQTKTTIIILNPQHK